MKKIIIHETESSGSEKGFNDYLGSGGGGATSYERRYSKYSEKDSTRSILTKLTKSNISHIL